MRVLLCGFDFIGYEKTIAVRRTLESINLKKQFEKCRVVQVQGQTTCTIGSHYPSAIVFSFCREDYDMAVGAIRFALRDSARPDLEVSWVKLEATTSI